MLLHVFCSLQDLPLKYLFSAIEASNLTVI